MEINTNLRRKTLEKILGDQAIFGGSEVMMHCPFCGDTKSMRAGYNLDKDAFHCFHCGIGFPEAFENVVEKLTGKNVINVMASLLKGENVFLTKETPVLKHHDKNITPVNYNEFLKEECVVVTEKLGNHPISAWDFVKSRKLNTVGRDFYYCHDKESRFFGRVIIPFFDTNGDCVYFQARYLGTEKVKIKYLNPHGTKDVVFGLDKVDRSKTVPVLEGPLDAMFVENAVAICSSAPSKAQVELLKGLDLVFMLDNDEAGLKSMRKLARKGFKVIKWPKGFGWKEDVNDYCVRLLVQKPKIRLTSFVEPCTLHPFQAEILLTLELNKKGLK